MTTSTADLQHAVQALIRRIAAGDTAAEAPFAAAFADLASRLFADDTAALLALVDQVQSLPLHTAAAQQQRLYFSGVAHFRRDSYPAALETFDALLALPELETAVRARALNARAVVYRVTGRLEAAMQGYAASLALWQQLGNAHHQGIVHLNLGIIAYELRRHAAAESHLHTAAGLFAQAGSPGWLATVQNELGLVRRDLGQWDAALAAFDAFIALRADVDEDVGIGLANRGEVLLFKGDVAGARAALQAALTRVAGRTYHVDHLLFLGLAHQAAGDLPAALDHFQQARDLARSLDRRDILPHVLYHVGDALWRLGERRDALAALAAAADVIQATQHPLRDEALKISLLGRWQQVYEALVLHHLALDEPAAALAWAEQARARAFADALGDHAAAAPGAIDAVATAADMQAALPPDTTLLILFTTGVLEQDLPLLRAIPATNPLRDQLLLPARTLLFVVTRSHLTAHDCGLDPNRFATRSPRGFDAARFLQPAVLAHLRQRLLAPAGAAFAVAARLVIVPHGPLHRVPFAALLPDDAAPTLALAPSGTLFVRQAARPFRPGAGCLAVGHDAAGRLPYVEAEARQVAALLGGEAWIDPQPKQAALRQAAAGCRWLHFACHGQFDDADPLASYLETAVGERLTAREVLESWQLRAELVTLSACETGVSQILRGDEPMGLLRAFLAAGAHAVLVSLWRVDDLATFLLMGRFYGQVRRAPLGEALRDAQAWLRQLSVAAARPLLARPGLPIPSAWDALPPETTPFADPYHWAAFTLIAPPS